MTEGAETARHLLHTLGLELWHDREGNTRGRAPITPMTLAPGTDRPRLGVFAALADVIAGIPVDGPINPTIDLRVTVTGPPPSRGTIEMVGRPVKAGRRLFLGEVTFHAGTEARPFARAVATFLNRSVVIADALDIRKVTPEPPNVASYDELLALRSTGSPDAPAFELDTRDGIANTSGVITGGAQALMAEIAAERVLPPDREWAGVELDLRFVNAVRTGPLVARPERPERYGDDCWVRVPLTEGERLITVATLRFVPVESVTTISA